MPEGGAADEGAAGAGTANTGNGHGYVCLASEAAKRWRVWIGEAAENVRMESMTLDADWLVTMAGPVVRRGRVVVEAGRIAAAGPAEGVPVVGRHLRLGPAVLMPGLINAHCHLELSAYHGALAAGELWGWLRELVMLRLAPGAAEREKAAAGPAVRSMVEAGTTCVGDISRAEWLPGMLAGLAIRKVCYVELISGAMSPPADMAQLRERLDGLPGGDPLLAAGISPHAPYTVGRADLEACAQLAGRRGLALALHLAETVEEIEWLRRGSGRIAEWHARFFRKPPGWPGAGPTEYALGAGLAGGFPAALIHMNYADDWRLLGDVPAGDRPAIVYCPRSHRFFGHAAHPFREMVAAGMAVAIGTDSAASHDREEERPVSVLDELRWLWREYPDVPAEALMRMATVHGAAALGLGATVGRVAVGMQADLAAFELAGSDFEDPIAAVLDGSHLPSLVSVAGQLAPAGPQRN